MNIGLDGKRALNNLTGLGQYARILTNALVKNFPQHHYELFTPKVNSNLANEIAREVEFITPTSKYFKSYWRSFGIKEDILKSSCDIYHGLSNELPFNIHQLSKVKKIVTIHDLIFLKHKEQYRYLDRQIYNFKTEFAVKNADVVIAISKETKNDLMYYYSVPEAKVKVVYQSCSPLYYNEASAEHKKSVTSKYMLPEKYILNVSSFFPRKNHKAIVEALDLIKNKTDVHVVFIGGQGTVKNELMELIKLKKLDHRVHIFSKVLNEDMPAIYQQAQAFVYPSFFEGFGIPILEALFSKVPVITSRGGCFEEAGGKDVVYINPSDSNELSEALYEVLSNSKKRNAMVQNGLIHAASMTDDAFAKNTMKVYEG